MAYDISSMFSSSNSVENLVYHVNAEFVNDKKLTDYSEFNTESILSDVIQKNINVKFESINNSNHFFKNKEKELAKEIDEYIKDKITF